MNKRFNECKITVISNLIEIVMKFLILESMENSKLLFKKTNSINILHAIQRSIIYIKNFPKKVVVNLRFMDLSIN